VNTISWGCLVSYAILKFGDLKILFTELWPIMIRTTVIAKRQLIYVGGFFGLAAYLAGLVFIDKGNFEATKRQIRNAMEKLKKEHTKLWIFPEGTRHNDGAIHEFKKGAFHTAIEAQVPILPVVFSSYRTILNNKAKVFKRGEVIIEALPEISTKGLTSDDVDELMEQTRRLMIAHFSKITMEVENL